MKTSVKPTYFISDAHLNAGTPEQERVKREKLAELFDRVAREQARLFILGDFFDFWFEFRNGYPRGYEDVLDMLKSAIGAGAEVHFIGGNHDWWAGKLLEKRTGVIVHKKPFAGEIDGFRVFTAHGDGLARSDIGYRWLLKPLLRCPITIFLFRLFPGGIGQLLARLVSDGSRLYTKQRNLRFEREYVEFARRLCERGYDLVVLGHTHEPARTVDFPHGKYINTGDFFKKFDVYKININFSTERELVS